MTTIPDDIQRAIDALATIAGMTPDAYCNRWWADVRLDVAVRGGIEAAEAEAAEAEAAEAEAAEAEAAAMTTTTTEEPTE